MHQLRYSQRTNKIRRAPVALHRTSNLPRRLDGEQKETLEDSKRQSINRHYARTSGCQQHATVCAGLMVAVSCLGSLFLFDRPTTVAPWHRKLLQTRVMAGRMNLSSKNCGHTLGRVVRAEPAYLPSADVDVDVTRVQMSG